MYLSRVACLRMITVSIICVQLIAIPRTSVVEGCRCHMADVAMDSHDEVEVPADASAHVEGNGGFHGPRCSSQHGLKENVHTSHARDARCLCIKKRGSAL